MSKYYIDYFPSEKFLNNLQNEIFNKKIPSENIVLNLYTKELLSNNVNSLLYREFSFYSSFIPKIIEYGYKINIVFDSSCLGNIEFSESADILLSSIDRYMSTNPDFITITNNFCFNYIKNRYPDTCVILSEYLDINNVQKINRYLELGCCGVKINTSLAADKAQISYIAENYDKEQIHININKNALKDDIFSDALNYRTAHFIQKGEYSYAKEEVDKMYSSKESDKRIISLGENELNDIIRLGFSNFWFYCDTNDEILYLNFLKNVFKENIF